MDTNEVENADAHVFLNQLGARGERGCGSIKERLASLLGDYYDGKPLPSELVITEARFGATPPMRRPMGHNPTVGPVSEDGEPELFRTPSQRIGDMITWLDRDGTLRLEGRNSVRRLAGLPIITEEPVFDDQPPE